MGEAGKTEKAVLLEFGPDIRSVHVSWDEWRVLHVQAAESVITKRYDAYEGLPRVVITNPKPFAPTTRSELRDRQPRAQILQVRGSFRIHGRVGFVLLRPVLLTLGVHEQLCGDSSRAHQASLQFA